MSTTQIKPYREVVDGIYNLNFHPGQSQAWRSTARIVAILAGTQWGKTCFEPDWLYREIGEAAKQGRYGDWIVGTATFPLLGLKLLPEFKKVFCELLNWGKYNESREGLKVITSHDGKSRIIFFSATNPESIESATALGAVLDEAGQKQFQAGTWEAVIRRLSISQGRILIGTTLYTLGWLKAEVHDRWVNGDKTIDIIQSDSTVNPVFPKEEYERARSTLPSWKFDMFYRGRFAKPAGMIYDAFNELTCVKDRFPIPESWLWYVGHDFGGSNPAAMFYAVDSTTGLIWAVDEFKPGHPMPTYEIVEECKRRTKGRNVIKRSGGSHQESGWRGEMTAHGWPVEEPIITDVELGINRVYALHKLNKIMVFRDLKQYIDEKQSYSRELDDRNQPTEKIDSKAKYHLMDCERGILQTFTPETVEQSNPFVIISV